MPDPLPDKYLQRLRRRAFLAGLTVSGTAIGNTFTHPAGLDRDREIAYTKLWIDRAADMGAPTIRIFAGNLQKGATEAQARQWCIDAIRECCEYAGRKGVILALENHGGIVTTAEQLVSIVREIDSEWFGVTWDSGNFRSADPYAELAMIAPYAVTAQIKTKIAGKPADLARIVRILNEVNYRGWLALEYRGRGGAEDRRAEISGRAPAPHGRSAALALARLSSADSTSDRAHNYGTVRIPRTWPTNPTTGRPFRSERQWRAIRPTRSRSAT